MGRTTIQVSDELADELYKRKQRKQTYEDVIWGLIDDREPSPESEPKSPAPEPTDDIDELLKGWPPEGDAKRQQRLEAGTAALEYLCEVGEATASEVKSNVEPGAPVKNQSPDTWYRKAARPAFKQAQKSGAVSFQDGSKIWKWEG